MDDVDSVRVFVAEDQPEMRALIARVLRQDGYEVIEAGDGTALIDSLVRSMVDDARMPDLIITDIRMPGASGLDVAARLRRSDWTTPIIFITAFGDDQAHAEARRLGAVGCLDKPFDLDELRAMVRSLHEPR
ncbi:MAG TPA: response regulator [Myxococcaceae bacterium]|nr:response regulator [Myxococcaceae bacterium]